VGEAADAAVRVIGGHGGERRRRAFDPEDAAGWHLAGAPVLVRLGIRVAKPGNRRSLPFDREEIASGGAAGLSAAISLSLSDGQSLGGCDYGSVPLLSRRLIGSPVRASVAGSDPELAMVDRSVHANAGRPRHLEARVRLAVKGIRMVPAFGRLGGD
jgi:hypothetical protein